MEDTLMPICLCDICGEALSPSNMEEHVSSVHNLKNDTPDNKKVNIL